MDPLLKGLLWSVAIILAITLFCAFTLWIFWKALQTRWQSTYQVNLMNRCLSPVDFQPDQGLPEDLQPDRYLYPLALTLLNTSIKTTRAACTPDLPRVFFPGYRSTRLSAPSPYGDGVSRQFAIVWENQDRMVMVFDGTMFSDEWMADFDFPQLAPAYLRGYRAGVKVHTGFSKVYQAVRRRLWSIWRAGGTDRELVISGHSLGAAVSNLAALDFYEYSPVHYTYGSPRTGNRVWADTFNRLVPVSWRVYNAEDLITEVPPPIILGYVYSHIGQPVTFDINLGSVQDNHVTAYLRYLPREPCGGDDGPVTARDRIDRQ